MNIRVEQEASITVIGLSGRLDGTTVQQVETAFLQELEKGDAQFVFDVTELVYVSSVGLRVLLLAAKKTRAAGGKIALFGLQDNVREVFEVSGFHTIFSLFSSLDEAKQFVV